MTTATTKTSSSRIVTRLGATNYRNLSFAPIELPNPCFLIGPNGAGKSNFCELLTFLKSLIATYPGGLAAAFRQHGGIPSVHSLAATEDVLGINIGLSPKIGFSPFDSFDFEFIVGIAQNKSAALMESEYISANKGEEKQLVFRFGEKGKPDCYYDFIKKDLIELTNYTFDAGDIIFPNIPEFKNLAAKFSHSARSWTVYNCNNFLLREIKFKPSPIDSYSLHLQEDGMNYANVIFQMHNSINDDIVPCVNFIKDNIDSRLRDIKPRIFDNRFISMSYKRDKESGYLSLDMLSDGQVRFLLLSSILLHPEPQDLIVIDEPELGLHPQWMKPLMELIWRAAEKTQVIIATHSPDLLDYLDTDEAGHVIVAEQDEQGLAQFNTLDAEALSEWLHDYSIGELYRLGRPEVGGWT